MTITLNPVEETLRIPLACRAAGDKLFPHMAVQDAEASRLLAALNDDGSRWLKDRGSIYGTLARTRVFTQQAQAFLQQDPLAQVINLGCGLSNYGQWLDNGQMRMRNADRASGLPCASDFYQLSKIVMMTWSVTLARLTGGARWGCPIMRRACRFVSSWKGSACI